MKQHGWSRATAYRKASKPRGLRFQSKNSMKERYRVFAADLVDYGLEDCVICDYRSLLLPLWVEAVVTNPPCVHALEFLRRALSQVGYVAFLVRSNFLIEAEGRDAFFEEHPPARVYHSSQRLPRMHRFGWAGKKTTSQTPFSWLIWDRRADHPEQPRRYRWKDIWREYEAGRLDLGAHATTARSRHTEAAAGE